MEPRSTGRAISRAVWVPDSENRSRKRGAKALIRPQTAKETANEKVPRARWREWEERFGVVLITGAPASLISPAAGGYITARFFSDGAGVEDGGLGPEIGVEGHGHVAHGEPAA